MTDPINPRLGGEELLELILRQNPHLSRDDVLAIASAAGFDLLDLRARPQPRPRREPAEPQ